MSSSFPEVPGFCRAVPGFCGAVPVESWFSRERPVAVPDPPPCLVESSFLYPDSLSGKSFVESFCVAIWFLLRFCEPTIAHRMRNICRQLYRGYSGELRSARDRHSDAADDQGSSDVRSCVE